MVWLMRGLALGHFAWGLLLLTAAAYLAASAFGVLPHMSSGTVWSNLPWALLMAAAYASPLGALGIWMGMLGIYTWTLGKRLRLALLLNHGLLLLPGALAILLGVHGMRAAELSTAKGGGLLSPIALVPLFFGIPVLALALCSIALAMAWKP